MSGQKRLDPTTYIADSYYVGNLSSIKCLRTKRTKQATYVLRNIESPSRNHVCSGKSN